MKKSILFILTLIAASVLVAGDCQHGQAPAQAKKDDCCAWMKDAKFEVVNTETGVKLTVTAANADTVKAVQEHFAMMAKEGFAHKGEMAGCKHGEEKAGCKHEQKAGCKPDCKKDCCKDKKAEGGCKHGEEKKVEPAKCPHAAEKAAEQPKS